MPSPRKLALGIAAVLATALVALIALPYLFRDRIAARLKAEANRSVNARVDWSGVGLSLFGDFPNLTLTLDRPSVVGVAPFAGDTLVAMQRARLSLDLASVVGFLRRGESIVVRAIDLQRPAVRLRVLADGRKSWDIAKPSAAPSSGGSGKAVGVTLKDLSISDGLLRFDDQESHLQIHIDGLEESLQGDFGQDRFVLTTRTRADSVSLRFAGIPYLSRVRVGLDAEVDADTKAQRFTLKRDTLRLNDLLLAFAGSIVTSSPDLGLDLEFSAPSTAFKDILSLVPAVYAKDFAQVQATGKMAVSGTVKGSYGPKAFPALALRARVDDGSFRYPSLPLPAKDIALQLAIDNPGGHVDSTVVDLERFHAAIGGRPLDARLVMRTPVSDPDVDLRVTGSIDLADVARTVKLEDISKLSGLVAADVAMRARMSSLDAKRYERIDARGTVNAARVAMDSKTLGKPVAIDTIALRLTPRTAELSSFSARIGKSDVRATGSLDNLLGFLLRDDDLRGTATVSSRLFDLDEWVSDEPTTEVIPVPAHIDFALQTTADKVTYGAITATNVKGGLRVKDERITLQELQMQSMGGTMVASGYYETVIKDTPAFDVNFRLASLDIPTAFKTLVTVQKLAPVAKWAQGVLSGAITLKGTMDNKMMPVFTGLSGQGGIETGRLALEGVPALGKLADALQMEQLRNPAVGAQKAAFTLANGRVNVKPFAVRVAGVEMAVTGSHGIDQTLDYDLGLAVPRSLLAGAAGGAVAKLVAKAGKTLGDSAGAGVVQLAAKLTGSITSPSVAVDFRGMAASAREAAENAVKKEVEARTAELKQKADSAEAAARVKARAEADRIVAEAQRQADSIKAQARRLAEDAKRLANQQADSLLAKATNPVAKIAAKTATDRLKKEAEQKADRAVKEADARADALVLKARQQADALVPPQDTTKK